MKRISAIPYLIFFVIFSNNFSKAQSFSTEELYETLEWSFVGPTRGGRSTTVCGVESEPYTFFMGTTGGGVWKTSDAGNTWKNVSDGQIKVGSIGAV